MFDKMAMSQRFFSCYPDKSRSELGEIFGVRRSTVAEWATNGTVPWSKLKYLSDSQAISWDWLIDGEEPKESSKKPNMPKTSKPIFPTARINRRFLSLYQGMTQTQIARALKAGTSTVNDWKTYKCQVPWQRLAQAVASFGVKWDWLIDGLEPKQRQR